jgi:hypothetical protein
MRIVRGTVEGNVINFDHKYVSMSLAITLFFFHADMHVRYFQAVIFICYGMNMKNLNNLQIYIVKKTILCQISFHSLTQMAIRRLNQTNLKIVCENPTNWTCHFDVEKK